VKPRHLPLRLVLLASFFPALAACSDAKEEPAPGKGAGGTGTVGGAGGVAGKVGATGGGAGAATGGASAGSAGAQAGLGAGGASAGSGSVQGGSGGATGGAAGSGAAAGGAPAGGRAGAGQSGASGADAGESGASNGGGGDSSGAGASAAGRGGSSGGGAGGSSGGESTDVFGITELYPSAPSGKEWDSQHWDGDAYEIDEREDENDPSGLSGFRGTGTLEVTGDGELVMSGTQPRIYIYPGGGEPWRDVEFTAYYQRVTDSDTAYAGLVMGARTGENGHSSGTECDAHTYYARVRNDGAFDFEKELKHPASSTQARVQPDDAWPDGEVPRSTWIGFKFVIYNLGDTGTVKFEAYRDMTNGEGGGDWELVNETIDDGGWFVETDCDEHDPSGGESDMIVLEGGTVFIRNTDVEEARYRWVTVREIDPG
jgi:hypothetical protein